MGRLASFFPTDRGHFDERRPKGTTLPTDPMRGYHAGARSTAGDIKDLRRLNDESINLSEQQKTCLRLVNRGMSSKEIAYETGLSHQTVDTYLKLAIARLGAQNRRDAARILAAREASRKSGSPATTVVPVGITPHRAAAIDEWQGGSTILPPVGGAINRMSSAARTYAALRIAALSAATIIALALFLAGALRTLR